MIEFRTLGALDLRRTDGPELDSLLAQPKRIALLAYLCLASPRGFHRRDTILGLFWPDSDETHARSSLRRALHVMRQTLGVDALHSRGDEEIAPNFDAIWCDAVAFDERVAANKMSDALDLYRGDLLPGFFVDEVPAFERWLDGERNRLRTSAAHAAHLVAKHQEADHNLTEAVRWARRAVELTDTDERAVRRLIELLARVGDRAGALQVYDDFATRLAADLEAEPSAETRALADRVRSARPPDQPVSSKPSEPPISGTTPHGQIGNGYRIEREIGRGGTAVVFLAGDLKHGRTVALKVLRPEIAAVLGTQRFFAEMSITAGLNHPNIVTLLDSGEIDGAPFYTMPYVAGETLRARLRREGALGIADALRISCDVAQALSHAHSHGVFHRDVKPENILLDNDRTLVTDFGIAQALTEATSDRLTQPGIAMGTAAYMSPEQADGVREVDARTDIYSLGCVLYEMLTGDPPFTGSSKHAILARKLAEPVPPLRNVREGVSSELEQAVLKALARTPGDRFRTATEFSEVLQSFKSEPRAGTRHNAAAFIPVRNGGIVTAPVASRRSRLRTRAAVSASVVLLAAAGAVVLLRNTVSPAASPAAERTRLTSTGFATRAALSPDGQFLAYLSEGREDSTRVIVQDLTGGPPDSILAFIPGAIEHTMEWSPNGARLLIRIPGKALILRRRGGRPEIVRSFQPGDEPHWLPDGSRISLSNLHAGRLLLVNPDTGDSLAVRIPRVNTTSTDGSWSRDLRFAIATWTPDSARWVIRSITLDGRVVTLLEDSLPLNSPHWSPSGDVLYYLRGSDAIWRVKVSRRTGRITGAPERLESGLDAIPGGSPVAHFSLSGDGHKVVFAKGAEFSNIFRVDPVSSTTSAHMKPLTSGTAYRWSPVVSPNGRWIAFAAQTRDGAELFQMPFAGGPAVAVTSGARVQIGSDIAWAPDGRSLAFQSVRAGTSKVWVATVSTGELRSLSQTNTSLIKGQLTWAPGSRIAYKIPRTYIRTIDPATGKDELLVHDTANAWFHMPRYSPGGREIAMVRYHEPEKNLISILRVDDGEERRLQTRLINPPNGLLIPRAWSADGRFLFVQVAFKPTVLRIDAYGHEPPDTVFTAPVRNMECVPEPVRNRSFICAVFDFFSDIWMIENFDRSSG